MIIFEECQKPGYSKRTLQNIIESDATIAFATNFNSPGEKLTSRLCHQQSKPFIQIQISEKFSLKSIQDFLSLHAPRVLNVAGNSISTMKINQKLSDVFILRVFTTLKDLDALSSVERVQSGGQSGIDESAIKAAMKLGIPAKIVAPLGWTFRNEFGNDISSESQFKARYL